MTNEVTLALYYDIEHSFYTIIRYGDTAWFLTLLTCKPKDAGSNLSESERVNLKGEGWASRNGTLQ